LFLYFAKIAYLLWYKMGKLVDMPKETFALVVDALVVDALEVFVS